MANFYFGIDISKGSLDMALVKDGSIISTHVIENTRDAINEFFKPYVLQFQLAGDQAWICMEHTGIYNNHLLEELLKFKLNICVESALQIKQSQGITRGKSDAVDAKRIALYAYKNREFLKIWEPQRTNLQKLKALLAQRDRLVKVRTQLNTPVQEFAGFLNMAITKSLKETSQATIKAAQRDILKIEKLIDLIIQEDKQICLQFKRATSVTGIGKITALHMIIASGEFERIRTPKQFACHAGVAPFEKSSGSSVRGKTKVSKMANLSMKRLLHMAALSAIHCPGDLMDYYQRKVAQGKNKMSVLNAVRNKLISRVYACVSQERDYQKNYLPALV
jgi:transposase